MGYGDELIASGQARGAHARGKRIAFGDGSKIIWHPYAERIFAGNPNVAPPGSEKAPDIEWIANYKGNRPYARTNDAKTHWIYTPGTVKVPGEVFLNAAEQDWAQQQVGERPFVLIEPSVAHFKQMKSNKQWPVGRYMAIAEKLQASGYGVVQFTYSEPYGVGNLLGNGVQVIKPPTFRHSLALMQRAQFYVGPEGGMHHGAAAVGIPAVVIFGGYISPDITGYTNHYNHYAGGAPCGRFEVCQHCAAALASITVEQVFESCRQIMKGNIDGNVQRP